MRIAVDRSRRGRRPCRPPAGLDRRRRRGRAARPSDRRGSTRWRPRSGQWRVAEHGPYHPSPDADAVVLATPVGYPRLEAARADRRGHARWCPPRTRSRTSRALLDLGPEAEARGSPSSSAPRFSPGLTCVLARLRRGRASTRSTRSTWLASGTAARPAPASTTARSAASGIDWRDGGWRPAPGRLGPRAVLVPRSDRRRGLLPGRVARRPAAGAAPSRA